MRKWQEVLKISSFFEGKKGIDILRQMPSFVQPVSQLNCTSMSLNASRQNTLFSVCFLHFTDLQEYGIFQHLCLC